MDSVDYGVVDAKLPASQGPPQELTRNMPRDPCSAPTSSHVSISTRTARPRAGPSTDTDRGQGSMASAESISRKRSLEDVSLVPPKKFKTSELPLNAAQRSSIDSLLHTIKKKGEFDALRKKVWSQYDTSDAKKSFTTSLIELAELEIDRDSSLLSRDRGKAATLIEGAVDRSQIYKEVETGINQLIAQHIGPIEVAAREIRRQEVGGDVAADEEKRGSKTDEEYAQEVALQREAREKIRKQEETRKRREAELEKLKAEEKKKAHELAELRRAEEIRKEEEAREERRRQDREAQREIEKQLEEKREAERQERYERRRREERERDNEREQDRARSIDRDYARSRRREDDRPYWANEKPSRRSRSSSRPHEKPTSSNPPEVVDEKALEEAALELLLREGRELAAKSGPRPDFERSESLEPPPRKGQISKPKPTDMSREDSKEDFKPLASSRPDLKILNTSSSHVSPSPRLSARAFDRPTKPSRSPSPIRRSPSTHSHRRHRRHFSRHRTPSHSRSRSRSRRRFSSRWAEEKRIAELSAKEAWKEQAVRQRERDAAAYKRASREERERAKHRSRSRSRSGTRLKERDGDKNKDSTHHHHRGREYEDELYRNEYRRHRERSSKAEKEYEDPKSSKPRNRSRSRSPVEIDRYVPGGVGRAKSAVCEWDGTSERRNDRQSRESKDREHREYKDRGDRREHRGRDHREYEDRDDRRVHRDGSHIERSEHRHRRDREEYREKDRREYRDHRDSREHKDRDHREYREYKEHRESGDRDHREYRESKDRREQKDQGDRKESHHYSEADRYIPRSGGNEGKR